jgi:hypothetical protein
MSSLRRRTIPAGEQLYLCTPASQLPGWTFQVDRDYFAKPVLVEVVADEGELVRVTDHRRGHTYPCDRTYLKNKWQLTNKQRRDLEAMMPKFFEPSTIVPKALERIGEKLSTDPKQLERILKIVRPTTWTPEAGRLSVDDQVIVLADWNWHAVGKPYFRVHPNVSEMLASVKLDVAVPKLEAAVYVDRHSTGGRRSDVHRRQRRCSNDSRCRVLRELRETDRRPACRTGRR